MVLPPC